MFAQWLESFSHDLVHKVSYFSTTERLIPVNIKEAIDFLQPPDKAEKQAFIMLPKWDDVLPPFFIDEHQDAEDITVGIQQCHG